ncbi:MAG: hypothetical protein ACKOFW_02740 [Planctomycetaceae bacterium]
MRLLSVGTATGLTVEPRPARPEDHIKWDEETGDWNASPDPTVAGAALAVAAISSKRAAGRQIQELVNQKNAPLMDQAVAENLLGELVNDLSFRPSESRVRELVRLGEITQKQADDWVAAEDQRKARLQRGTEAFAMVLRNQKLAEIEITGLNLQAEVMEGQLVADQFAPALRSRAGTQAPPELAVHVGYLAAPTVTSSLRGFSYISVRSRADYELTRVTLLVKLTLPLGSRYACAYIPKIPAGGTFRLAPVDCTVLYRGDKPLDGGATQPSSLASYSIWCDQFSIEDQRPATDRSALLEYAAQAMAPGMAYVDRSQLPSNRGPVKPVSVEFTELEPTSEGYRISAEIQEPDPKSSERVLKRMFSGTMVSGGKPSRAVACKLTLQASGARHELTASILEDGEIVLGGGGPRNPLGNLVAAREVARLKQSQQDFHAMNDQLVAARKLIMNGQRDEAQRLIDDFLAGAPGEKWEAEAREIVANMDQLERMGERLREARRGRENMPPPTRERPTLGRRIGERPPPAGANEGDPPKTGPNQPGLDDNKPGLGQRKPPQKMAPPKRNAPTKPAPKRPAQKTPPGKKGNASAAPSGSSQPDN